MGHPGEWPPGYTCLPGDEWVAGAYRIRPIARTDAEPIREWRNAQIDVLRQDRPLSPSDQDHYFEEVVRPQLLAPRPPQVLFGFEQASELIGYGGLVHISWADLHAELSFLVDPRRRSSYREDLSAFVGLLTRVAADGLGLHRIWTETYDVRAEHIGVLEECGLVPEGRMRDHVIVDGGFVDSLIHGVILTKEAAR